MFSGRQLYVPNSCFIFKYGELLSRGNFSREDIVTALTAHHGDLEAAYTELTKGQLKPFLRRMWAPNNHIGTANHFTH